MSGFLDLPPAKKKAATAKPVADELSLPAAEGHTQRYPYMIKINRSGSDEAGWVSLVHDTQFTRERFAEMVQVALTLANTVRVPRRAQSLKTGDKPLTLEMAKQLNAQMFPSDVDFIGAVLGDKYGFVVVHPLCVEGDMAVAFDV
jgi:hypothetical protein